jgi:hypothetical protein
MVLVWFHAIFARIIEFRRIRLEGGFPLYLFPDKI